jgi:hypothetical protein
MTIQEVLIKWIINLLTICYTLKFIMVFHGQWIRRNHSDTVIFNLTFVKIPTTHNLSIKWIWIRHK